MQLAFVKQRKSKTIVVLKKTMTNKWIDFALIRICNFSCCILHQTARSAIQNNYHDEENISSCCTDTINYTNERMPPSYKTTATKKVGGENIYFYLFIYLLFFKRQSAEIPFRLISLNRGLSTSHAILNMIIKKPTYCLVSAHKEKLLVFELK